MVNVASWCRACGVPAEGEGATCARCGTSLDESDPGPPRIGLVAVIEWRRARHLGVVTHESAGSVHLLVAGASAAEMPLGAFDAAAVDVPGPAVTSAAGRLWKALAAQRTGSLSVSGLAARWHPEVAASVAHRLATASIGARRAAARDALALGTPQAIGGLGLTADEVSWYLAWAAAAAADTRGLLDWLDRLPPTGYQARTDLLTARATDLMGDRELGARAAAQLAPFTASDADARALHAVLTTGQADTVAVLRGYLATSGGTAELAGRVAGDLRDLRAAFALVLASEWTAALAAGTDLAGRACLPATRAEARNIAAFCQYALGDPAAALHTLGSALDDGPAAALADTGLLVNASVVAADAGAAAALPYLARIAASAPGTAVRSAACRRAMELWTADPDAKEYPGTLRAMVRDALAARQEDDEFHRQLLRFASLADRAWLAREARIRSVTQDQADAERYWRTWALATDDGAEESLSDVAALLGELARRPASPAWVRAELRDFAGQLNDGVHVGFGEAAHLVPVIEALLGAGVLDLDQRLVLAAQAGAHLAAYGAEHDGLIAPEHEQRLLLEVAAEYGRRHAELTAAAEKRVSVEVARCLAVAARTVALAALADWEEGANEWNELVNGPSSGSLVRKAQLRVLDRLQLWRDRLRGYRTALDGVQGTEANDDLAGILAGLIDKWSAEITRLRGLV